PVGQRAPGRVQNLQRAADARAVVGHEAMRGRGVARQQLGIERGDAFRLHARAHALAYIGGDLRHRRQANRQRLEIKPGAADQNRHTVLALRLLKHGREIAQPLAGGIVHAGIDMAVKPVRNARLVPRRRPRGNDAQIAIDLHRVGIDDDAAGSLGKLERQRRLAARGRPCNKHRLVTSMTHVATLIAPAGALDKNALKGVLAAMPHADAPVWLAEATAADIPFSAQGGLDQQGLAGRLRQAAGEPVDVVVQPLMHRRKKLFLADMDSTMIGQECIDELADFVGLKAHVAAITERAMRGEIAFEPALRERVALLKGLPTRIIGEVIAKRITLTPGARTLVATMRANGAYTCMVSGGFTLFTQPIAALIDFNESRANTLVLDGALLAGSVSEPIFGRARKRATLIELRTRLNLAKDATMATGDGANDIDMITEAGLGIAYHAKPKVAQAAAARIDYADLTALLYVQGYKREEFVAA